MTRILLLLLGLAACAPGAVEQGAEEGEAGEPLTNGATTRRFPAVGRLMTGPNSICTVTLVGAHTVLSAAHCVLFASGPVRPGQVYVRFDAGDYVVRSIHYRTDPTSGEFAARDVSILELARDVVGVRPMPLAASPPEDGEAVLLLGYGDTTQGAGADGARRIGLNDVEAVYPGYFEMDGATGLQANICAGDSGGPTFVARNGVYQLLGVHSNGTCDSATTFLVWDGNFARDARVDGTNRGYIEAWAGGDVRYAR
jgi:hypothetical protein